VNVLAIETSGPIGSAGACRDDDLLSEARLERGMEHGRMLLPLLDRVVKEAGWDKTRDLDLIAVSRGPGSFTGLRVGVTCAKTIALHLGKPLVGVCSFDAMARNAPREETRILTVLDAKRGQVYAAAYERRESRLARTHQPMVTTPGKAAALLRPPFHVMGDALLQYADMLCKGDSTAADQTLWRIRAKVVAQLGLAAHRSGRHDNSLTLAPLYLRLPEAEEKRLDRERDTS